jgi:hypothetical protein
MNKIKIVFLVSIVAATMALVLSSCGKSGGFAAGGNVTFFGAGQ